MRPRRKFTYINKCYKYVLFFANFIFWVLGMLVMAAGITAYILGGGLPESAQTTPVLWFFNLTILVIVLGIVVTIVSFAGCIGSLRENTCLLKFYSYTLIIMFLGECTLAILGFVYKDNAIETTEEFMVTAFIKQYWEIGFEDTTNLVDALQKELSCCGPKGYSDYNVNRYYSCNKTVNKSPTACGVPYSCCRNMNNIDVRIINTACGYNAQSIPLAEATRVVWTNGCVTAIVNFIEKNVVPILGVTIGVAFIQLIAAFLSRVLATQIQEQRKLLKRMLPPSHE